jgi:hypothetical protein
MNRGAASGRGTPTHSRGSVRESGKAESLVDQRQTEAFRRLRVVLGDMLDNVGEVASGSR